MQLEFNVFSPAADCDISGYLLSSPEFQSSTSVYTESSCKLGITVALDTESVVRPHWVDVEDRGGNATRYEGTDNVVVRPLENRRSACHITADT